MDSKESKTSRAPSPTVRKIRDKRSGMNKQNFSSHEHIHIGSKDTHEIISHEFGITSYYLDNVNN